MLYEINRADVWVGEIEDRAGGLADKLAILAKVGANLEFVVVRRLMEKPGKALLFASPLRGAAAKEAGLSKASSMCVVRIDGPDQPGLGARIGRAIANEGISMRGMTGASIGNRNVIYISFGSVADADQITQCLNKTLAETQLCP